MINKLLEVRGKKPGKAVSLSEDELSPAALAARVVLKDCVKSLIETRAWTGARFHTNSL